MAFGAMIYRGFVRVVANIARLITLMGSVGVRLHAFGSRGNFCMITVAALANRGFNLLGRRIFLMAPLATPFKLEYKRRLCKKPLFGNQFWQIADFHIPAPGFPLCYNH